MELLPPPRSFLLAGTAALPVEPFVSARFLLISVCELRFAEQSYFPEILSGETRRAINFTIVARLRRARVRTLPLLAASTGDGDLRFRRERQTAKVTTIVVDNAYVTS